MPDPHDAEAARFYRGVAAALAQLAENRRDPRAPTAMEVHLHHWLVAREMRRYEAKRTPPGSLWAS